MIKSKEFAGGNSGKIATKMNEWRSKHEGAHELFHDAFPHSVIITYDEREVPDDEPKAEPVVEEVEVEVTEDLPDESDIDESDDEGQPKRSPGRPKKIKEAD